MQRKLFGVCRLLRPGFRWGYASNADLITLSRDHEVPTVAVLQFNQPDKLNALTEAMGHRFTEIIEQLCTENSEQLRAVVLTGAGKAFSAGGDLAFLQHRTEPDMTVGDANVRTMLRFYESFLCVRRLPVPVISAINGHAIGAGFAMTLATDIRIVANEAKLALNFTQLGLHPGMGSTHFLPLLVGHQNASFMLLSGGQISGVEAKDMGIALRAVPKETVLPDALAMARTMAKASPVAVRTTLLTLRAERNRGLEDALIREADAQAQCYAAPDLLRGLKAIKDKHPPAF
uniref:Uncharacterized protein n=1 Tax=Eutreptiella gymnastica TaxID=73025 RepID=A0A7S4FX51_9EUGL